jgi:cysteinyl-tRNA synthetase
VELRYYLAAAHYRSPVEFSIEAVEEAAAAYRRVERFVFRVAAGPVTDLPPQFSQAMDNDLNVPQALSAVHAEVGEGNQGPVVLAS